MNTDMTAILDETLLASHMAVVALREGRIELERRQARIDALEAALARMVKAHDDLVSDTEGQYPVPSTGCIECTLGTVPNRLNTGLCAYHNATKLLAK